jgi:hypothetical protein
LLTKNLRESDHLGTIALLFGEVNKSVCSILLITWTSICQQGLGSSDGKWVAHLISIGRCILTEKMRKMDEERKV